MDKLQKQNYDLKGQIQFSSPKLVPGLDLNRRVTTDQDQSKDIRDQKKEQLTREQMVLDKLLSNCKNTSQQNRQQTTIQKKPSISFFSKLKQGADEMLSDAKIFLEKNLIKKRQMCHCSAVDKDESCHRAVGWLKTRYQEHQFQELRSLYKKWSGKAVPEQTKKQIELDVVRTYPDTEFFREKEHKDRLRRVLLAFASYDPKIGYVQGLNYVVGVLLYHAEEHAAFWVLVILSEDKLLRNNYLNGLPGLYHHLNAMDRLLLMKQPELHAHLADKAPALQHGQSWVLSLMGSVMSFNEAGIFLEHFIERGWKAFYQIYLQLMDILKEELMLRDAEEALMLFNQLKQDPDIDWKNIIRSAAQVNVPEYSLEYQSSRP